jgi:hypothetical protein
MPYQASFQSLAHDRYELFSQLKEVCLESSGQAHDCRAEALALYERNWHLVDREAMDEVDYESIAMWTGHREALSYNFA